MRFTYQVRDVGGQIREGELTADSRDEATLQLRQEGYYLLSIDEAAGSAGNGQIALFQKKVTRDDIIYFTNQLAVMIDAGVPLATALQGLAKQADNPTFQTVLTKVHSFVEAGDDLSAALSRFPKQFDRTYVNLVKASEASGTLGPMLDRIAVQARNELETRQKVRGALMYPAGMLVMCVGVSIFLLTYVFPKLMPMFESRGVALPGPTKVMIFLSNGLTNYWYLFVGGAIGSVVFLWWMRKKPWGRAALDWFWLNLPIMGPMLKKVAISRSLRTLATTINSGVPVLESLELCAGVANNVFYERCWINVGDQVTSGKQIHEALDGSSLFPPTLLQMISSGEATGKLGHVLNKVSDYFDREVSNAVKAATSMIEPLMVAVMGSVIGLIALAMLLPIFTLSSTH